MDFPALDQVIDSPSMAEAVEAVYQCLAEGGDIAILTGAGVSKESGIPTFRDAQTGMWAKFNPEDLATRSGFMRDPKMVWQWYDFRRNKVWMVEPNPGHFALAMLEKTATAREKVSCSLITQNIDGLHQRAGSERVLELHGNIFRYKCLEWNHPATVPEEHDPDTGPPRCPQCNSLIRPDVVWFGENLDEFILAESFRIAQTCKVMIVAGTSGVVQPAASLPVVAREEGAFLIEVNPEPTELTWFMDVSLKGPSGVLLKALVERVLTRLPGR